MQVANITAEACELGRDFQWGGRRPVDVKAGLVSLEGDDGRRGTALAWTAGLAVRAVIAAIEEAAVPHLVGAKPLDRPRILEPLWRAFRLRRYLRSLTRHPADEDGGQQVQNDA